ncbi:MAG: TPM domain-containing protein, partial [Nakamurella sp.]
MAGLRAGWAGFVGVGAVLAAVLLPPTMAAAEPPFRVPTQITDRAGVLSGGDQADVQAALDKLSSEDNVNLFVVYVDTFDNPIDSDAWAGQTAELSSLGSNQILLAVAVGGTAYAVNVPDNFKLSSSQLQEIAQTEIQPKLADEDWAGAAIAAANGYSEALGGSSTGWWWVAGGIVVVGGGGYLIYRRTKRKTGDSDGQQPVGQDGAPAEPLEPLDQLSARSVQTLIDTDNAVRASEFELNAAETEFGSAAVAEFRAAFDSARESLTAAFEIR